MAKSKASNPVDAFRKQQRARELKKNKEGRKKVRETQTVKKDTRELESEIRELKSQGQRLDAAGKTRLSELESELNYVTKVKEKFVEEHPEARDKVFRKHREGGPQRDGDGEGEEDLSHLYNKDGKLRDPTRSVYYDPVYNPFGAPPPGMPYKERTPEDDDEDDEDSENESEDDIIMPEGPPPDEDTDNDTDDSDDIPLPSGPPPPKAMPLPKAGPSTFAPPPLSLPVRPPFTQPGIFPTGMPPFPPSQPGFQQTPARPQHRPPVPHNRPPSIQDPLSDAPTQTYQGYRMTKHDLPARPTPPSSGSTGTNPKLAVPAIAGGGTISAEPQLRDLRKEATAFVPRGVKRKKPVAGGGARINAAPGAGEIDADGDEVRPKRADGGGLMGKLNGVLGDFQRDEKKGGGDDDYQKFLEGLEELT